MDIVIADVDQHQIWYYSFQLIARSSNRHLKITCGRILKRLEHLACFANVRIVSYTIPKEEDEKF